MMWVLLIVDESGKKIENFDSVQDLSFVGVFFLLFSCLSINSIMFTVLFLKINKILSYLCSLFVCHLSLTISGISSFTNLS